MEKTYTLKGTIPSKKNQKQIVRNKSTGRMFIIPSNNHQDWHHTASTELLLQQIVQFTEPVSITVGFTFGDRRKHDLSNKFESIADLLVDCGVLVDDNYEYLPDIRLHYAGYCKGGWSTTVYLTTYLG